MEKDTNILIDYAESEVNDISNRSRVAPKDVRTSLTESTTGF